MKSVVLNGSSVEAVSLLLTTLWFGPVPCLFGSVVRGLFGRLRGAVEEGLGSIFEGSFFCVLRFLPSPICLPLLVAAGLRVVMLLPSCSLAVSAAMGVSDPICDVFCG